MGTAHISRLNGKKTLGWQVRVGPKRGYHSKLFSDSTYGGADEAREAAEAYLEVYLDRHPGMGPENPGVPATVPYWDGEPSARNTSGHIGVYRSHEYLDSGTVSDYWGASFPVGKNGGHSSRIFRITVYGDQHAYDLAVAYRKAWEKACEAAELDRFFEESDYPARFKYTPLYFHRPEVSVRRKVHIARQSDSFWCGKDYEAPPWLEMIELPDPEEICLGCRQLVDSYEHLINLLLYYHQPDEADPATRRFLQSILDSGTS